MATRIFTCTSLTVPTAVGTYRDLKTVSTFSAATALVLWPEDANGDRQWQISSAPTALSFYSERVSAVATISGTITFNAWATCPSGFTAKIRAKLSKVVPAGGTNDETVICQQDSAQLVGASPTKYTFTVTPPAAITVGPGERFILRIFATPISGSFGTNPTPQLWFGEDSDTAGNTWVEFTETVTFLPNVAKLFLRRTTASGIGNFFDMLDVRGGSAATTGVVNTAASGTEIQWTRTAGGTVLEWISPRLALPWNCATEDHIQGGSCAFWTHESAAQANSALRVKVFRRTPAGVETLVYTHQIPGELGTSSSGQWLIAPGTFVGGLFLEDDRIILRPYITNVGTMPDGRTCTFTYDHNVAFGTGDSYIVFLEAPLWKAEGDPAAQEHQSRLTMGGIGN